MRSMWTSKGTARLGNTKQVLMQMMQTEWVVWTTGSA